MQEGYLGPDVLVAGAGCADVKSGADVKRMVLAWVQTEVMDAALEVRLVDTKYQNS